VAALGYTAKRAKTRPPLQLPRFEGYTDVTVAGSSRKLPDAPGNSGSGKESAKERGLQLATLALGWKRRFNVPTISRARDPATPRASPR
jgi:hypothetical protein